MARKIKPIDLQREINSLLDGYVKNVQAVTKATSAAVARNTVQTLKSTGDYKNRTGRYRKSFRFKTYEDYKGSYSIVYAVKPGRRIAHLLEKGKKDTRAYPHWKPAEEKAIKEFESTLTTQIESIKD